LLFRCGMDNCNKAFTSSQHLRNHFSSHNCKYFPVFIYLNRLNLIYEICLI
jgi:hypothetical protein